MGDDHWCKQHPSMRWLPRRDYCALCEDWSDAAWTPKDKLYEFVTVHRNPGTVIQSKGQWKKFLKSHHYTDDVSVKEKMDMVSRGYFEKKKQERQERLKRELQPVIAEGVQQVTEGRRVVWPTR